MSPADTDLHIVILWRKDRSHLKFEWFQEVWHDSADKQNYSKEALKSTVHRLLHSNDPMPFETEVQVSFANLIINTSIMKIPLIIESKLNILLLLFSRNYLMNMLKVLFGEFSIGCLQCTIISGK